MQNLITLTDEQWSDITENSIYPSFITEEQEQVISKALFAYMIDGDIEELDRDIISVGITPPDLGKE